MPWVEAYVLALPHVEAILGSADYHLLVVDAQMHFMNYFLRLEGDGDIPFLYKCYLIWVVDVELYWEVFGENQNAFWYF